MLGTCLSQTKGNVYLYRYLIVAGPRLLASHRAARSRCFRMTFEHPAHRPSSLGRGLLLRPLQMAILPAPWTGGRALGLSLSYGHVTLLSWTASCCARGSVQSTATGLIWSRVGSARRLHKTIGHVICSEKSANLWWQGCEGHH